MLARITHLLSIGLAELQELDKTLFIKINNFHHPIGDIGMYWITHDRFWFPLYAALLVYIIKKIKKNAWLVLLSIVLLIFICDQFASSIVKPWVGRYRPCLNPEISIKIHLVGHYRGIYGFISSHAANTFGLVTYLCLVMRPRFSIRLVGFVWAALIGYGRVYGGVHYPGDIILGAISGIVWACLLYRLARRHLAFSA